MPILGGFQTVAELDVSVLNQFLQGAWRNSIIPHSYSLPAGLSFGPYQISEGTVNIPRADLVPTDETLPVGGLALTMDTAVNGVRLAMDLAAQIKMMNPIVPSLEFFDLQTQAVIRVPIGTQAETDYLTVCALLNDVPRSAVSATVTSGDPIPPITLPIIAEYLHARYTDGTIPHNISLSGVSLNGITADVFTEIFDDPIDPARQIEVTEPASGQLRIRIPMHVRMNNLSVLGALQPLGVLANIVINVEMQRSTGLLKVKLSTATVTVEDFFPASGSIQYDIEGANYTIDKNVASLMGMDLESAIMAKMMEQGQAMLDSLGDVPGGDLTFMVPTLAQIETFIADQVHAAVIDRGNISFWTPELSEDSPITVDDIRIKALPEALAICMNNPSGNTSDITDFIPSGRSCAIAVDGAKIIELLNAQVAKSQEDGGLGGTPYHFDAEGHSATLTRLEFYLGDGAIHVSGDVTVEDAIAGYIDADASFDASIGLQWVDNPSGGQDLVAYTIGEPDVDLSGWAWFLSILIGFVTGGIVGIIVAAVVMSVAEGLAEDIGGQVFRDEISDQVVGITPWPQHLEGIGELTTRFENPVIIDPFSVIFPDLFLVEAIYGSTILAAAMSNGPYALDPGALSTLTGTPDKPSTSYEWDLGDGTIKTTRKAVHMYGKGGYYVTRFTTDVSQEGGSKTREYTLARVRHTPAKVNAGPDITVNEGEVFEIIAKFTDTEWLDKHQAIFDFGDNSIPRVTEVTETNEAPLGRGEARASHAYCDNGKFPLTVYVHDDNGCIGSDTIWVTVKNVPPAFEKKEGVFAYPGIPVTLEVCFTDPGWCDTHTGLWEFGDCSPIYPAIIKERNEPPIGVGVVAAAHIYERCGNYLARCVVFDDDGGKDEMNFIVRVVQLKNADFEEGYRRLTVGAVANHWEPYVIEKKGKGSSENDRFQADEFIVHDGRRSQRIDMRTAGRTGLWQVIGANVGWDYEVSAWYNIDESTEGTCRLGLDPEGGKDPEAASVVWTSGSVKHFWAQLSVRTTAKKGAVTVFLEMTGINKTRSSWFDDVSLIPYPCGLKKCKAQEEELKNICVDWQDERKDRTFKTDHVKNGFTFHSVAGGSLKVKVGSSGGRLVIPRDGLLITLPFASTKVVAEVFTGGKDPVVLEALDKDGKAVLMTAAAAGTWAERTMELIGSGITAVQLREGSNESALIRVCIWYTSTSWEPKAMVKPRSSKRQMKR